jgi:tetratricopeptide (TPR) repeat protein
MNRFLNKSLRLCLQAYQMRPYRPCYSFSSANMDLGALRESFERHQDMIVFSELIEQSNNSLDNINYFKIFKILEDNRSPIKHYEDFFLQVNSTVTKKSDNIRMLLAKVKGRIAKKHEENGDYYESIQQVEQALAVLEDSLVPPLLLYYQMFRYYGHMQNRVGNKEEALEALSESVDMIERYLEHSDDQVTSNENCKSQAKAYNALVNLDASKADEWLRKANKAWEDYEGSRFELEEYAETVVHNARREYRQGKEKGEAYLMFNLYQFKKDPLKEKLTAVRK